MAGVPDSVKEQVAKARLAVHGEMKTEEQKPVVVEPTAPSPENNQPIRSQSAVERELALERQRVKSMKGRVASQTKQLSEKNKQLQAELDALKAGKPAGEVSNSSAKYLKEEEVEELGEDVLDIQARITKGVVEGEIAQELSDLKATIKELQTQVANGNGASVDSGEFWNGVERFYPNAGEINDNDPDFKTFLESYDPSTGTKNYQIGKDAIDNNDVVQMVELLEMYKPLNGNDVYFKPENASRAPVILDNRKKVWSAGEINEFYNSVTQGKFGGSKEQLTATRVEIRNAVSEGRVR